MRFIKIPEATIKRLSVYSRYLAKEKDLGKVQTSSNEIALGVGVNPAQVRKDLSFFGEFGTRGVGYNVEDLHGDILKILGLNREWSVALVGVGNLGHALISHRGFQERGFHVTSIFDTDLQKIGTKVNNIEVMSLERLEEVVAQNQTKIGIITAPYEVAQDIADSLVKAGVEAILNFAPGKLNVPPNVNLRNVDLAVNLEILTYHIGNDNRGYSYDQMFNSAK